MSSSNTGAEQYRTESEQKTLALVSLQPMLSATLAQRIYFFLHLSNYQLSRLSLNPIGFIIFVRSVTLNIGMSIGILSLFCRLFPWQCNDVSQVICTFTRSQNIDKLEYICLEISVRLWSYNITYICSSHVTSRSQNLMPGFKSWNTSYIV